MPRFVVLEHRHQGVHWDFMLEAGPVLRTWALSAAPDQPGPITGTVLPDHRPMYLDYEGPISRGRGHVVCWDRGTFRWVRDERDCVEVVLSGERLSGAFRLRCEGDAWSLEAVEQ